MDVKEAKPFECPAKSSKNESDRAAKIERVKQKRARRPDMQVYVPRARRSELQQLSVVQNQNSSLKEHQNLSKGVDRKSCDVKKTIDLTRCDETKHGDILKVAENALITSSSVKEASILKPAKDSVVCDDGILDIASKFVLGSEAAMKKSYVPSNSKIAEPDDETVILSCDQKSKLSHSVNIESGKSDNICKFYPNAFNLGDNPSPILPSNFQPAKSDYDISAVSTITSSPVLVPNECISEQVESVEKSSENDNCKLEATIDANQLALTFEKDVFKKEGSSNISAPKNLLQLPSQDVAYADAQSGILNLDPEKCSELSLLSRDEVCDMKEDVLFPNKPVSTNFVSIGSTTNELKEPDHMEDDSDEDSWDAMFDDFGESLNPDLHAELDKKLGNVKLKSSKIDYLSFTPQETDLSTEEFQHILELYDFPAEFKTRDLLASLSQFQNKGFDIKWVDDTHALAVFSSPLAAATALNMKHALIKSRPLSQAISKSKQKARHCSEFLLPYKLRPKTSAVFARRMVAGALGLQSKVSNTKYNEERKQLKEAQEKKKFMAKQKKDIWEGNV